MIATPVILTIDLGKFNTRCEAMTRSCRARRWVTILSNCTVVFSSMRAAAARHMGRAGFPLRPRPRAGVFGEIG